MSALGQVGRQVLGVEHFFRRLDAGAENWPDHFVAPQAEFFWIQLIGIALPWLDFSNGLEGEPGRIEW